MVAGFNKLRSRLNWLTRLKSRYESKNRPFTIQDFKFYSTEILVINRKKNKEAMQKEAIIYELSAMKQLHNTYKLGAITYELRNVFRKKRD